MGVRGSALFPAMAVFARQQFLDREMIQRCDVDGGFEPIKYAK